MKRSTAALAAAPPPATVTFSQTQRSSYADYEHERRLRLLRIISPLFWGLESLYTLGFFFLWLGQVVRGTATFTNHSLMLIALLVDVSFSVGLLAQRRGNVAIASWAITGVMAATTVFVCISESLILGINPYTLSLLAGFTLVIVLAGAVGSRTQIAFVTVLALVGTLGTYMLGAAPMVTPATPSLPFGMLFIVMADIALAGIMFAWRSAEQHTVEELQAVRLANERAARLDQLKNSFIRSVNHEIRNPVMAIMGSVQNYAEAPATVPRERLQRYAARAFEACLSLRHLLDSILEVRNLDGIAQNIVLGEAFFSQIMHNTLVIYPDAPVRLQTSPEDPLCRCDPIRMQQVMTNLISNAIKYSPPGSPIDINAAALPGKNGAELFAEIVVKDYGLGIPPDEAPLLFNQFIRLERDLASTVVGNGLGLYLCKTFVEAMGGRIWVESTGVPGEGSAFHIRLPRIEPHDVAQVLASMTPTRRRLG